MVEGSRRTLSGLAGHHAGAILTLCSSREPSFHRAAFASHGERSMLLMKSASAASGTSLLAPTFTDFNEPSVMKR